MARRGNKEGSICKRPYGKFRAQVSLDGRRLSFTGSSRSECQMWLRKMRDKIDGGLTFQGVRVQVKDFMAQYLEGAKRSLRPNIAIQYAGTIRNHIIPGIGEMRLIDLRPEHIDRLYQNRLDAGISARTVQMIHSVLHRALHKAVEMGYLTRNPADGTTRPRLVQNEMLVLNEDQAYQFLIASRGSRLYALYHLAVKTGMRQGEILGLRWDDLNWRTGILQIKRQLQRVDHVGYVFAEPKTKSGRRTIRLGQGTMTALRDHQLAQQQQRYVMGERWQENNLIFPSTIGTPMDLRNLLKDYKKIIRSSGLPNIRFHDLRHTAATIMLLRGVPIFTVSKVLGHSKPSVTLDIYGHLIPGALEVAAQVMEDALTPVSISLGQNDAQMVERSIAPDCTRDEIIAPELHPKK